MRSDTTSGLSSTSLLVGLIATFGGYHILGLAIHGNALWYLTGLWIVANLLIGFSEEILFRGYFLTTLADGIGFWAAASLTTQHRIRAPHYFLKSARALGRLRLHRSARLIHVSTPRRTGSLAFAIGFHAAFDFAKPLLRVVGSNAGVYAVGHLLETRWQGPQWLTGGFLGPEASWMIFVVIALMFVIFDRRYPQKKFPH